MQENPRIKMIREKIVHNCKHPIQFIGKTVRGTLGTANIVKNAAFQTITYDLSSPAEQQAMQNQLQNQYDNLIQTVKEITPGQLDTFVSDVIADMATLKIFNVIAKSGKDIASQASSSRNAPGTAITPCPDQLPAVSRCAKKETPIITSKHLAAQRLLQDQQRAPQASTSHANSSGPQASTSASKNVDKGKYPANKPAAVEDKGKFKGTTEESAKRTGQVEKDPTYKSVQTAFRKAIPVERQTIFKEAIKNHKDLRDFYNIFGKEATMEAMESVFHDCKTAHQLNNAWPNELRRKAFDKTTRAVQKLNSKSEWIQNKYDANGNIRRWEQNWGQKKSKPLSEGVSNGVNNIVTQDLFDAQRTIAEFTRSKASPIWKTIEPTQGFEINTAIPRGFIMNVEGKKIWVKPNATKHLTEKIGMPKGMKNGAGLPGLANQQILASEAELCKLYDGLKTAVEQGIKGKLLFEAGGWEFKFDLSNSIPELFHVRQI